MRAYHRMQGTRYNGKTMFMKQNRLYGGNMGTRWEDMDPKEQSEWTGLALESNASTRFERETVEARLARLPQCSFFTEYTPNMWVLLWANIVNPN